MKETIEIMIITVTKKKDKITETNETIDKEITKKEMNPNTNKNQLGKSQSNVRVEEEKSEAEVLEE